MLLHGSVGGLIGLNDEGKIYNCMNLGNISLPIMGDSQANYRKEWSRGNYRFKF